jgi:hypothetical protein
MGGDDVSVLSYRDEAGFQRCPVRLADGVVWLALRVAGDQPLAGVRRGQVLRDVECARAGEGTAQQRVTRWMSVIVTENEGNRDGSRSITLQVL